MVHLHLMDEMMKLRSLLASTAAISSNLGKDMVLSGDTLSLTGAAKGSC